jgi:transposase
VVARKLDRARLERLCRIGIDEVSYLKGHKYLTVVANHDTGDPVWIGEGRTKRSSFPSPCFHGEKTSRAVNTGWRGPLPSGGGHFGRLSRECV